MWQEHIPEDGIKNIENCISLSDVHFDENAN